MQIENKVRNRYIDSRQIDKIDRQTDYPKAVSSHLSPSRIFNMINIFLGIEVDSSCCLFDSSLVRQVNKITVLGNKDAVKLKDQVS